MILTTIAPENQVDNHEENLERQDLNSEDIEPKLDGMEDNAKFLKIGSL
jgi:hypothetical protein